MPRTTERLIQSDLSVQQAIFDDDMPDLVLNALLNDLVLPGTYRVHMQRPERTDDWTRTFEITDPHGNVRTLTQSWYAREGANGPERVSPPIQGLRGHPRFLFPVEYASDPRAAFRLLGHIEELGDLDASFRRIGIDSPSALAGMIGRGKVRRVVLGVLRDLSSRGVLKRFARQQNRIAA
jgi:hypothetical protein